MASRHPACPPQVVSGSKSWRGRTWPRCDGPTSGAIFLGGWCLGGDIAFEMAHYLRDAGADVALVLMFDNPSRSTRPR